VRSTASAALASASAPTQCRIEVSNALFTAFRYFVENQCEALTGQLQQLAEVDVLIPLPPSYAVRPANAESDVAGSDIALLPEIQGS